MTSGGETPRLGVPGAAKLSTRAPKAWHGMASAALVKLPASLARSQRLRQRLRRVR